MIRLAESGHHSVAYSVGYCIGTVLVYGLLLGICVLPGFLALLGAPSRSSGPAAGGGSGRAPRLSGAQSAT